LQRLVNSPDLADVQFSVEGQPVYAHKAILAIRSEYFRVLLCGGMRESRMLEDDDDEDTDGGTNDKSKIIDLPDVSYSVFLKVLEFLYTDSLSRDTSLDVCIHLLIASEQFLLDRLKAICEDLIRRDVNTDTVVSILAAAHRHRAGGLKEIALEFILRHLNHPTVMACLADLKTEPDLLLEIIRRSNLSLMAAPAASGGHANANNNMHLDPQPAGPFGPNQDWNRGR
jgi:BTB/POZ domain